MTKNTNSHELDLINEQALLGSIIISGKYASELVDQVDCLKSEHFIDVKNQLIYKAILSLHSANKQIDSISVSNFFSNNSELKIDMDYIQFLISKSSLLASPQDSVNRIIKNYKINEISKLQNTGDENYLAKVETIISSESGKSFDEEAGLTFSLFDEIEKEPERYPCQTLQGDSDIPRSGLMTIAARLKVGKTTIATQLAHYFVSQKLAKVCFFSMELTKSQIFCKYVSLPSSKHQGTNPAFLAKDIRDKTNLYSSHVQEVAESISNNELAILDGRRSVEDVIKNIKQAHRAGYTVFFIDQLSKFKKSDSDYKLTTKMFYDTIVEKLSVLANKLEVLIVILSQCNREIAKREDKLPTVEDISDSDFLAQEAALIWVLAWDDANKREKVNMMVVDRFGKGGLQKGLIYNSTLARFEFFKN